MERVPGVRVAVGSSGSGVAGFRHGHLDALEAQRMMHRLGLRLVVATHAEMRVVALAGADETTARAFIAVTLGPLASAPAVLRSTLRAMIAAGFDSGRVAGDLGTVLRCSNAATGGVGGALDRCRAGAGA